MFGVGTGAIVIFYLDYVPVQTIELNIPFGLLFEEDLLEPTNHTLSVQYVPAGNTELSIPTFGVDYILYTPILQTDPSTSSLVNRKSGTLSSGQHPSASGAASGSSSGPTHAASTPPISQQHKQSIGPAVGGAVSGLLIAVVVLLFWWKHRRSREALPDGMFSALLHFES